MRKNIISVMLLFIVFTVNAQNNPKPCSSPEASQFDFWVGDWTLYTADTITGTNTIYKVMDGCTIQENFNSPGSSYTGKSWSVYNPQTKLWQQTWVDNQGEYISLTGKFEAGKMTLVTPSKKMPNGREMIFRMIFYNINKDSFDWSWEGSSDAGLTWKLNWQIHYIRKK